MRTELGKQRSAESANKLVQQLKWTVLDLSDLLILYQQEALSSAEPDSLRLSISTSGISWESLSDQRSLARASDLIRFLKLLKK